MTGAACLFEPAPADTGDVLASIRRLIASDNAATGGKGSRAEGARMTGGPLAPESAPPCATSLGCARSTRTSFPDGQTVQPDAARVPAATLARPPDVGGQMPLLLKPESMVAAADGASQPAGRLRLSPDRAAACPPLPPETAAFNAEPPASDLPPDAPAAAPEAAPVPDARPDPQPVQAAGDSPPAAPKTETRASGPHDVTSPSNKETAMQAYPTGAISPLHAEPVMAGAAERCAHGQGAAQAAPAPTLAAAQPAPGAEENPLRALLREVVREEFEAEMQRRLDDSLRGMIRGEIVVALTEALVRRPA